MPRIFNIPLELRPQPEREYVVTSPMLLELLTEGDMLDEALPNVEDAFAAVLEMYRENGRPLTTDS